jgi:hypothetical protein
MEIEVLTSKKKLTKSMVSQMYRAGTNTMAGGEVLGYLVNCQKNAGTIILIKFKEEYTTIENNWRKGELRLQRPIGRYWQTKKFSNEDDLNAWWKAYQRVLNLASQHIYI